MRHPKKNCGGNCLRNGLLIIHPVGAKCHPIIYELLFLFFWKVRKI